MKEDGDKANNTKAKIMARAKALRDSFLMRMEPAGISPLDIGKMSRWGDQALRNILRPDSRLGEPGLFRVADGAAVLGVSLDEMLRTGNQLRHPVKTIELSTAFLKTLDTKIGHSPSTTGREGHLTPTEIATLVQAIQNLDDEMQRHLYVTVLEQSVKAQAAAVAGGRKKG